MKKILYSTIVAIGICNIVNGMTEHPISYHSLVEENKVQEINHYIQPEVQKRITECTLEFVSASLPNKKNKAKNLIQRYKAIFCNSDNVKSEVRQDIEQLEADVKDKISSELITEIADSIVYLCDGVEVVATDIQIMYEVLENYNLSLLWALVAYKLGCLGSTEAIGRLIVGMGI